MAGPAEVVDMAAELRAVGPQGEAHPAAALMAGVLLAGESVVAGVHPRDRREPREGRRAGQAGERA